MIFIVKYWLVLFLKIYITYCHGMLSCLKKNLLNSSSKLTNVSRYLTYNYMLSIKYKKYETLNNANVIDNFFTLLTYKFCDNKCSKQFFYTSIHTNYVPSSRSKYVHLSSLSFKWCHFTQCFCELGISSRPSCDLRS